ncbi:helix-turn-helix domain-containing protein [Thiomicrorhabdus sp.]|uniref:helix-turn-helix domain-containing protein n=1 Tax=Thiomicrorhabdus sp. TaxID=2039724 RepID=UPI0029C72B87|nr:helix-turn-helix domain-containing protein [Thiomicrorhabdus sp.]
MMTPQGELCVPSFVAACFARRSGRHGNGIGVGVRRQWFSERKVAQIEEQIIREALIRLRWNKTKVAEELGLSRVGLRQKMERFGITENLGGEAVNEKVSEKVG